MSRSAADATRFTATSPHAYAKPTPINRASPSTYSASSAPRSNPNARLNPNAPTPPPPIDPKKGTHGNAPPGETPAEKVARLRQRTTVVTAAITGISMTDMIIHNRRKRSAFYAEQHALYSQRLIEAIETEKSGMPLDEDQTLILNRERARVQAEEAAKERTWGKRIKGVFIGDLKTDEEGATAENVVVPSEGEILQKLGVDQTSILERATQADRNSGVNTTDSGNIREEARRDGSRILQAVAEKRRQGERAMEAAGVRGGPLDQMAEGAVQAVGGKIHAIEEKVGSERSWNDWWVGK
ncbi:MAG: hypothetical protein ASARMPREDX12_000553 [Alectoria sarmentosa]|nr:MAG: hypothetical protein ASARMPREDX12_000553 [Alectoria sarmentosa]